MLRKDGVEVTLESGAYGSFQVRADDKVLVDGGPLAFLGVLPSLAEIRSQVVASDDADSHADGAPKKPDDK